MMLPRIETAQSENLANFYGIRRFVVGFDATHVPIQSRLGSHPFTFPKFKMAASSIETIPGLIPVHKQLQKKEKTPTLVFKTAADANRFVATEIANLIRTSTKKPVVLGLATGSTPVGTKMTLSSGVNFSTSAPTLASCPC